MWKLHGNSEHVSRSQTTHILIDQKKKLIEKCNRVFANYARRR